MGKKNRRKNTKPRYWHGGSPGLDVGTVLEAPLAIGLVMPTHHVKDDPTDPAWLYVTTDRPLAKGYAGHWRHPDAGPNVSGDLYRVEPVGGLEDDPDYPDLSYRCRSARIIAVEQRAVRITPGLALAMHRHNTWDDGLAMYDQDGYILPCQKMLDLGVTATDLRGMGFLPDPMQANVYAGMIAHSRGDARSEPGPEWQEGVRKVPE